MSNMLLAKPKLPEGWIDLSVGEPRLVRSCLEKYVEIESGNVSNVSWDYPDPQGYKPLVDYLQNKHKAPVVITNGAKQGLAACFSALAQKRITKLGMKSPYWALIPPLADSFGLKSVFVDANINYTSLKCHALDFAQQRAHNAYLLLAPNNPDGSCNSYDALKEIYADYYDSAIPFIHDAAYFTNSYLPFNYQVGPLGDMQIFSISKMYGLSGLRLGYVVCHDEEFFDPIKEFIETDTVGVSSISQYMLYNLISNEKNFQNDFERDVRNSLIEAKNIVKEIPSSVLEIPDNILDINGMFLWAKCNNRKIFKDLKINIADGINFGNSEYIRINLAVGNDILKKVADDLKKIIQVETG